MTAPKTWQEVLYRKAYLVGWLDCWREVPGVFVADVALELATLSKLKPCDICGGEGRRILNTEKCSFCKDESGIQWIKKRTGG